MQTAEDKYSWFDIPAEIKELFVLASKNWEDAAKSEAYINEALAKAEANIDVLVGAYRYFFYKNKPAMALQIAQKVMQIIKSEEKLPDQWEKLEPILSDRKAEPKIRLYINAYAATGFMLAKLGKLEDAKTVTERVTAIDENRESCATTIFEVLTRNPEDDDD